MNAYFEIGGHIIETHVQGENVPGRPPKIDARSLSKELNVPAPLLRAASKDIERKTGVDPMKVADSWSRARRARWAITTAATLAMADGPLPFGDMIAIGVLGGYAAYEGYTAVTQLM